MPFPENYVGFEDVFPNEDIEDFDEKYKQSEKYIQIINDHYDDPQSDSEEGWMPHSAHKDNSLFLYTRKTGNTPSLKRAVYTFLLVCSKRYKKNR